jgi:hypothetical protein
MNIIEAIKSGKRFRRKGNLKWVHPFDCNEGAYCFSVNGLIAEDWEVEEKKVTITAEQLETAFNAALRPEILTGSFYNILEELKKELGFKE